MQCDEVELFMNDALYRLAHSVVMMDRINDKAGYNICPDNLACIFTRDMLMRTEIIVDDLQKAMNAGDIESQYIPESYYPKPPDEYRLRELYFVVIREYRDQLNYLVDGAEFASLICT